MNEIFELGMIVCYFGVLDWGMGQVQLCIGDKIMVNFVNVGKQVVDGCYVWLEFVMGYF